MADISKINSAVSAYQKASNMIGSGGGSGGFSDMLGNVLSDTVANVKQSEIASRRALVNEISLDELAITVANAEMSLRTIVSIRDRIIAAYQDITKMPI